MNPKDIEEIAREFEKRFSNWEEYTLEKIANRINKTGQLSISDAQSLDIIATVNNDMQDIDEQLKLLTNLNSQDIDKMFQELVENEQDNLSDVYDYRNRKTVPISDNARLSDMIRSYSNLTNETLQNLSNTSLLGFTSENGTVHAMREVFEEVMTKSVTAVVSGAGDFNGEIRNAMKQLGGQSVRVDYGNGVTRQLHSVIRQNLIYTQKKLVEDYYSYVAEDLGTDGIEIDYHQFSRPSHEFMQGQVYANDLSGKTVKGIFYEPKTRAVAALNDYGCLHFDTPVILGVSVRRYTDDELKTLIEEEKKLIDVDGVEKTGYEWKQAMRQLESETRKQKNLTIVARELGDSTELTKAQSRISAYVSKYNSISKQTGIDKEPYRMSVAGYTTKGRKK